MTALKLKPKHLNHPLVAGCSIGWVIFVRVKDTRVLLKTEHRSNINTNVEDTAFIHKFKHFLIVSLCNLV